jgi:hypothetical protein
MAPGATQQDDQLAGARVGQGSVENKAADAGDAVVEYRKPAVATCCVCMEPCSSDGAHRVWYIHAYSHHR